MSAIFGKFYFDERPVSPSELLPMQQAMAYWGPDGSGTWCDGHVGMGHLKRNNTPESLRDALPWVCPASGDVITASVRLDNRDELFKALSIPRPDQAERFLAIALNDADTRTAAQFFLSHLVSHTSDLEAAVQLMSQASASAP